MKSKTQKLKKGLYIVSTPIGNLKDITFRAIDILKKSDIILCEDTRNSKKLLSHYDIKSKLVSKYIEEENKKISIKNTDINVLLNRVRLNKKNESRKKIYFSAASAAGLFLFGLIIF